MNITRMKLKHLFCALAISINFIFTEISYNSLIICSFSLKVVECVNADAIVVVTPNKEYKKIFFSSLRPPR